MCSKYRDTDEGLKTILLKIRQMDGLWVLKINIVSLVALVILESNKITINKSHVRNSLTNLVKMRKRRFLD